MDAIVETVGEELAQNPHQVRRRKVVWCVEGGVGSGGQINMHTSMLTIGCISHCIVYTASCQTPFQFQSRTFGTETG